MGRRTKAGIDGVNFRLVLSGADANVRVGTQELKNVHGTVKATVTVKDGVLQLYINMPRTIRRDNVHPFTKTDMIQLDADVLLQEIQQMLEANWCFANVRGCRVKSVEANLTLQTIGECTPSHVLYLLNVCCHGTINAVHQRASVKCKYLKDTETVRVRLRPNYYDIKAYDKSAEQRNSGNTAVEDNLLRIEIVMVNRTLHKIFGDNLRPVDVLQRDGLQAILDEYQRIFKEKIVAQRVIPSLREIEQILLDSRMQLSRWEKVIAQHKEIIIDSRLLCRASIKWYEDNGSTPKQARNNASNLLYSHRSLELPKGVVRTLIEFEKACGAEAPQLSEFL